MRFKIWWIFMMRMWCGPRSIIVAIFLQNNRFVRRQRMSISWNSTLFQHIFTTIIHRKRGSCRIRGTRTGSRTNRHRRDWRWIGNAFHVHRMRSHHMRNKMRTPRMAYYRCWMTFAGSTTPRWQAVTSVTPICT